MATDQQTIDSYNQGAQNYNDKQPSSFYHLYLEKPAMFSLLPELKNKRVLCIGVGTGQEANELYLRGAQVTGIDISEGMINQARKNFPNIEFILQDMNNLKFKANNFDFVYSSLAFHYAEDLESLFKQIHTILKSKGQLLFSTTHPIFDAVERFELDSKHLEVMGYMKDVETQQVTSLGNYFYEGRRTQDWKNNFIVNFQHKTITTWINSLIKAGFLLKKILEPQPIESAKNLFPDKYSIYTHRPGCLIFLGIKP